MATEPKPTLDLKSQKMSLGLVAAIIVQAFGIIWYVAQLDSTVATLEHNQFNPAGLVEQITALENRLDETEKMDAIMGNEMRTIMSQHDQFNAVLKDLGVKGYGDTRQYGNYGQ